MSRLPPIPDSDHDALAALNSVAKMTGKASDMSISLAHSPAMVRFLVPFLVVLQRNGAGSVTDARYKELAILRTSMLNECQG